MAFETKGSKIIMDAYDFGLQLPIHINDIEFEDGDKIIFELKKDKNSEPIITKEYENESNVDGTVTVSLEFTQKESESLFPGNYVYYLKHLRSDESGYILRDTLIVGEDFKIRNGH